MKKEMPGQTRHDNSGGCRNPCGLAIAYCTSALAVALTSGVFKGRGPLGEGVGGNVVPPRGSLPPFIDERTALRAYRLKTKEKK